MTTLLTGGGIRSRELLDDDVDLARDRVLVTRAQAGDRAAFDDLYVRYYRRLHRFCLRRLHDNYEAEDVAQEAFARAWRALPGFAGDRRFYPWLSVIAAHLCTDVLRRRNRSTPVAEFHQGNIASTEDGGEELMVAAVDSDLVSRAFQRLSDRHQRILNLREGSGWSYQRIADHEGVGITAVETLLWRARQALKREFAALAGAEGRTAAWIGGILSLATLRRMLRVPLQAARRLGHLGQGSPAIAVGSAAAATAMVVAATLSGGQPVAPRTSLPQSDTPGAAAAGAAATVAHRGSLFGSPGSSGRQVAYANQAPGSSTSNTSGGSSTEAVGSQLSGEAGTVDGLGQTTLGNGGTNITGPANDALSQLLQNPLNSVGNALGGSSGTADTSVGSVVSSLPSVVSNTTNTVTNPLSSTVSNTVGALNPTSGGTSSTNPTSSGGTDASSGTSNPATSTATTVACTITGLLGTLSGGTAGC